MIKLKFKRLNEDARMPSYAHATDAGMDVTSTVHTIIPSGKTQIIPTGLSMEFELPEDYTGKVELQVRSRSGLAAKYGVVVLNSPGTIDQDYRGEIGIILHNTGNLPYTVLKGDRIAQLVVNELPAVTVEEVVELTETGRGDGGFGSTGK